MRPQPPRGRLGQRRQRAELDGGQRNQLDPAARQPPQRGKPTCGRAATITVGFADRRNAKTNASSDGASAHCASSTKSTPAAGRRASRQRLPGARACLLPRPPEQLVEHAERDRGLRGSPLARSTRGRPSSARSTSAVLPTPAAPSTSANDAPPSAANSRSRPTKIAPRAVTAARTLPRPLTRGSKQLEVFPVADARVGR